MKGEMNEERFCPSCGAALAEDAAFCGSCGAKLARETEDAFADFSEDDLEERTNGLENIEEKIEEEKEEVFADKEDVLGDIEDAEDHREGLDAFDDIDEIGGIGNENDEESAEVKAPPKPVFEKPDWSYHELVIAEGLPEWDLVPPSVVVKRRRR